MTTTRTAPNPWRTRLTGLGATLTLLVLLAGIPTALWAIHGNPLPTTIPSWQHTTDALGHPDDGHLFLAALIIVAWLAWATFAIPVLVEVAAHLRGLPAPHLPGLQWQQRGAASLLAGAALLFTAGQAGAAALPHTTTLIAPVAMTATVTQQATPEAATESAPTQAAPTAAYTVVEGDTPWGIAHTHLGDGTRYTEITHPDGGAITGRWLHPGEVLALPAAPTATPSDAGSTVTVQAGDTLSSIARDHLGDPNRYTELADANHATVQPDGQHLTDADQISPGWTITLPGTTVSTPPVAPPAPVTPPVTLPAPATTPTPHQADTEQPQRVAAAAQAQQPQQTAAQDTTTQASQDTGDHNTVRTATGVGTILAAGVLGMLAYKRRNQQRHRRPGTLIPTPTGPAAATEQELRATAAPMDITTVDLALRSLAHQCQLTNQPLPHVRAARLTQEQFELYLTSPTQLPAPWTGTSDAAVWMLPTDLDDAHLISPEQAADVPAPYPSLVTIGHDLEDGHVFLDLEEVGALAVSGDTDSTRAVITALVLELATSCWADDLQVTIVGACADLETSMQTGRIRHLPDADSVLADLTRRAAEDRNTLDECDTPDLQHARVRNTAPGIWTPEIVLIADPITDTQRASLTAVLEEMPRVAIAAVTSGDPVSEWALTLGEDDTAILAPINLTLRPQTVDSTTYAHLVDVMATANATDSEQPATEPVLADLPITPADAVGEDLADDATLSDADRATELAAEADVTADSSTEGHPVAQEDVESTHDEDPTSPTAGPAEATPIPAVADVHQLHPDPAPRLLLLGPVAITGARGGEIASNLRNRATELAAYLALHPGVDHVAIDAAMSPGKIVSTNTRNAGMSRLRRWLGQGTDGDSYLPRHTAGSGYRLSNPVTTDWQTWCELLPDGAAGATTEHLEQALDLVRGRPFQDVKPRTYAWAEHLMQEMIAAIVDATHELGRRRLLDGRWREATLAAVQGLSVEPGMERLWRIRILAEHSAGNTVAVDEAVDRLLAITDELGGDLDDATEQLLRDLDDEHTPTRAQLVAHAQ